MKVIILAAGRGTRLKPLTNNIPKALVPLGEKTLMEKVLLSLPIQIEEVIIIHSYLGEMIEEKIGNVFNNKKIIYQKQISQKGTWSALFSAKDLIRENEKFLVSNCDDLFRKTELEEIVAHSQIGMGITKTLMPDSYYGIDFDSHNNILGFRKRPNATHKDLVEDWFANGLYILDQRVFQFDPVEVYGGEYGLPQTLFQNLETYPLKALKINNWQPCNDMTDLQKIINHDKR